MEKVSEEVVAHSQLRAARIWITHRSKEPCFEAMVRFALLAQEITIFEKPSFSLGRDLFAVSINTKGE